MLPKSAKGRFGFLSPLGVNSLAVEKAKTSLLNTRKSLKSILNVLLKG
jgi:hypothetical protein